MTEQKAKFIVTYCRDFNSAEVMHLSWEQLVKGFAKSVEFDSKEASAKRASFIGGPLTDPSKGRKGNVAVRHLAVLDYDKVDIPLSMVEFLEITGSFAAVIYSTFRHTPEEPRLRVVVPLSRPVLAEEYPAVIDRLAAELGMGTADKCSYVMNQLMFMPSHQPVVEPFFVEVKNDFWVVPDDLTVTNTYNDLEDDDFDDLDQLLAEQPLDIEEADIDTLLENYEAEPLDYDEWLAVGMGLWHQHRGSEEGYQRWLAWSSKSGKHDPRHMPVKWRSFGGSRRPVTLATVIKRAGGRDKALGLRPDSPVVEDLRERARTVTSQAEYAAVREAVLGLSDVALPAAMRSEVCKILHEQYGKAVGMTLSEVKKDLTRGKGKKGNQVALPITQDAPAWARDWVYVEADATYDRVSVRHSVVGQAFRTKYDRMAECVAAETDAISYVTRHCNLQTVASKMYWPGAGTIFQTEDGLDRLNTYVDDGVEPCATLEGDDEARRAVDKFQDHLRRTVPDERERRIVMDFMAYVYQNPGKRVQWALLMHGIEGNGKTYFFTVMQYLLGSAAKVVSTTAINSEFTGWAEGSVLINVEEIRIAGTNKYAILDKMKPLISNDVITVIHKGKDEKHIPNFTSYMMMTNHADAIPVSDNDRRYCVISTAFTRKEELWEAHGGEKAAELYFKELFDTLEKRPDALARMLKDWEVSGDFSPRGRAPMTRGLMRMRDLNVSDDRDLVEEALDKYACEIVGPDLIDVTYFNRLITLDAGDVLKSRALGHVLGDMGYQPIDKRRVMVSGGGKAACHYIWFRAGKMTSDEAVQAVRDWHAGKDQFHDVPF